MAVDAASKEAEALRAHSDKAVANRIRSDEFIGTISYGPRATGAIGVNYGVVGKTLGILWIGVLDNAQGDGVDGILFKSASLFSIDHPLDPKRKVLNHACVESPEYKTFYDGIATLDRRGRATVKLPRWFDTLNHDLRYQLTAIGAAAPELHIAREAEAGSFAIAGGPPGVRVCWQVTDVRRCCGPAPGGGRAAGARRRKHHRDQRAVGPRAGPRDRPPAADAQGLMRRSGTRRNPIEP